jgi:hypothetical protein
MFNVHFHKTENNDIQQMPFWAIFRELYTIEYDLMWSESSRKLKCYKIELMARRLALMVTAAVMCLFGC